MKSIRTWCIFKDIFYLHNEIITAIHNDIVQVDDLSSLLVKLGADDMIHMGTYEEKTGFFQVVCAGCFFDIAVQQPGFCYRR